MSETESSNNSDWAVVTQEGELESDEDASCSGSSIELLSSDDDSISQVDGSSAAGSGQSGAFFILRLRSKAEESTESDSDEKEVPVRKTPAQRHKRSKSTEKGALDDEDGTKSESDGCQTMKAEKAEENLEGKNAYHEEEDREQLHLDSVEEPKPTSSEGADSAVSSEDAEKDDDISFPSSIQLSSDESIPEVLNLVAHLSAECSNGVSLNTPEREVSDLGNISESIDDVNEEFRENMTDTRDDNSMTSSNFSLLGEECNQAEGQEKGDNKEVITTNINAFEADSQENDKNVDDDLRRRSNTDETEVVDDTALNVRQVPTVTVSQNRARSKPKISSKVMLLIEVVALLVVFLLAFLFGVFQGFELGPCNNRIQQTLNNDIEEIVRNVRNKTDNDMLEAIMSAFPDYTKEEIGKHEQECVYQSNEDKIYHHQPLNTLQKDLNQYFCKVRSWFKAIADKGKLETLSTNHYFIAKINELKNENADLQREVEDHGKKKYLIKELEDENIALFKRISDMENQLMETEGQVYVHQLQLSKCEKKATSEKDAQLSASNEKMVKLETEKKSLNSKISTLEKENLVLAENLEQKEQMTANVMVKNVQLKRDLEESQKKLEILEEKYSQLEKSRADSNNIPISQSDAAIDNEQQPVSTEDESVTIDDEDAEDEGIDEDIDDGENDDNYTYHSTEEDNMDSMNDQYTQEKEKTLQQTESSDKHRGGKQDKQKTRGRNGWRERVHTSWSDAFSDILNRTKISMGNVNQQIQETLSQVKNISEELWKKHEPQVNEMLTTAYENVKKNVHHVAKKVTHAAKTLVKKSAKFMDKYKRRQKNKRGYKKNHHDQHWDDSSYKAGTSRRGSEHYKEKEEFHGRNSYDSFLENELQDLRDGVKYTNMLTDIDCSNILDIMEDFQHFHKVEGTAILSKKEKSWFYCQKAWYESMAYSDPLIDTECRAEMGKRQLAASDNGCCPCFGKYGKSKGKFCNFDGGCSALNPKRKKWNRNTKEEKPLDVNEEKKNDTQEGDAAMNHGKYVYCDPFSQDLDCGDESWYLKRMKDREHMRKYRTSSKSDWLFHRAEERDFYRTQPDNWYLNRMSGGQAYEAYPDEMQQKKSQQYP